MLRTQPDWCPHEVDEMSVLYFPSEAFGRGATKGKNPTTFGAAEKKLLLNNTCVEQRT